MPDEFGQMQKWAPNASSCQSASGGHCTTNSYDSPQSACLTLLILPLDRKSFAKSKDIHVLVLGVTFDQLPEQACKKEAEGLRTTIGA